MLWKLPALGRAVTMAVLMAKSERVRLAYSDYKVSRDMLCVQSI